MCPQRASTGFGTGHIELVTCCLRTRAQQVPGVAVHYTPTPQRIKEDRFPTARWLEKEYEHGTHVSEYVQDVSPLGEDRKTILVPEIDALKVAETSSRTLGVFLTEVLAPLAEKYGDEVWEIGRKALYEVDRRRASAMLKRVKIDDLNDASCLGRIMDLEAMEQATFDALGVKVKKPIVTRAMSARDP